MVRLGDGSTLGVPTAWVTLTRWVRRGRGRDQAPVAAGSRAVVVDRRTLGGMTPRGAVTLLQVVEEGPHTHMVVAVEDRRAVPRRVVACVRAVAVVDLRYRQGTNAAVLKLW